MGLSAASSEQETCVQAVLSGNNVVIEASAGAGKSTTFYHTASAWLTQRNENPVLLVCFNAVLRAEAVRKIKELELNVHCFTVHALAAAMYKTRVSDTLSLYNAVHGVAAPASPGNYELVLIDEAQDLNDDHMEVLNALQSVLPKPMQYMVVGDPRQEIYAHVRSRSTTSLMSHPDEYLVDNKKPWVRLILNTSYRLTAPVCAFLNSCFRCPDTQVEIHAGNVRSKLLVPNYVIGDREQNHHFTILSTLLKTYAPGDIMILAPSVAMTKHRCQQMAFSLHKELNIPIFSTHKQRSDVTPAMMAGKLFLSTYHQSKGYERPCVLVLGVDEHEWYLNKSPKTKYGKPLVHNSLHVALTRAQEQLVIFQHYKCAAYPTIRDAAAHCTIISLQTPDPQPPFARSHAGQIFDLRLIAFQPRDVLTRILQATIEAADTSSTCSAASFDETSTAHLCKITPETNEDVMDAYLDAILGYAERRHVHRASFLEIQVRLKVDETQVPLEFKNVIINIHRNRAPANPREWLALAIVYNTMVYHDYPHELYQVNHLNWFRTVESEFIQHSVMDIAAVLPSTGYWHESAVRELQGYKIRANVPFMEYTPDGPEPWQFTLNDNYTEQNLLLAMVHMFVFRSKKAHVFSISTNTKHTIRAPENLNTFLIEMLTVKLDS